MKYAKKNIDRYIHKKSDKKNIKSPHLQNQHHTQKIRYSLKHAL